MNCILMLALFLWWNVVIIVAKFSSLTEQKVIVAHHVKRPIFHASARKDAAMTEDAM